MNCDRHRAIPAGDRAGYEMLNAYGKKSTRRQILGGDCASVGLRRATREMSLPSVIVTNGGLGCSAGANCNAGPRPKWCAHSRRLWGAKTWSEGPKTVQVPLVSLGGKRRNGFSVARAKRSRNSSLPACRGKAVQNTSRRNFRLLTRLVRCRSKSAISYTTSVPTPNVGLRFF
jgi:hypothetical protein